ncbi:MAG: fibrobacter succinogenes major paralogous domain-containing protein [Dysgonamonadaceae bacterium]|jgi:uncharacterized protein (TIGR02145 family)|nr:fibrobacter succinogenes major paralogous domain-containing protein [Dysgonamonadaceae bacterium]
MKQKLIFLALTLFVLSAASANAQVRIGGTTDPHSAATLDLNADNDDAPVSNSGGLYLPRIPLTSTKQQLNGTDPLNGAMIWNTNKDFYLGKGVYVWGDTVWVPIQRTLVGNSTLQPITTDPFVTILSNPALGLGVTFHVPAAYSDMSNTARFSWEVDVVGGGYDPARSVSGSRQEVLFVPYDNTVRTYKARVKALSNNGTSDSDWSAWVESDQGKYQGWYRINGATGYDINATTYSDPVNGRDADRTQLSLTGNEYTVETLDRTGTPTYQWSIVRDETGHASLGTDRTSETVELKFNNSILSKIELVNHPDVADTIVLQCKVTDNLATHTLQRKITVGDRDECSPIAGLADAEGNRYTVSKFGGVCWMTQNLRSTYTLQGNLKQEISEDRNIDNDYNAISYYYPYANQLTFEANPEYGLLYTWGAANIGTASTEAVNAFPNKSSDRQGICPDGWVIPSDYDWNRLEEEIATNPSLYSTETTPFLWDEMYEGMTGWRPDEGNFTRPRWGRTMKSPTKVVSHGGATITSTNGVSNTDGTGFNALLLGYLVNGIVTSYSTYTYLWSGSAGNATVAWRRSLRDSNSGVLHNTISKSYQLSVRCKK